MFRLLVAWLMFTSTAFAQEQCPELLDFTVPTLVTHEPVHLCESYRGKVLLIVNTASKCGYTYQYEGLEKLFKRYNGKGLVVLGFPSNDFAGQEPGSEEQIENFCRLSYGVAFPMFAKSQVKQGDASPLYEALARAAGQYPGWNFHKYLIGRDGKILASFASRVKPQSKELVAAIEQALQGE